MKRSARRLAPVVCAAVTAALLVATGQSSAQATPTRTGATAAGSTAGPAGDVVVNGWGDAAGYHLEIGRGASGYAWHEVAVLRPAGLDESSWTGYQCVTGDGRYLAVAVLPTSVVNLETARDRGAFGYSIDLSTGKVRPVASGVGLKYYSPGCGIGDQAVFTLNLGMDDQSTELVTADLATGQVSSSITRTGQLTSAVPTTSGIVAAAGSQLVRLAPSGADSVISQTPGNPYDLAPAADGGVNFLAAQPNSGIATAQHEVGGKLTRLASGPLTRLHLFAGRSGRAVLTGTTSTTSAAGRFGARAVPDGGLASGAVAASLDGAALLANPAGHATDPVVYATTGQRRLNLPRAAATARVTTSAARYEPPGATATTSIPHAIGKAQPHGDAAPSSTAVGKAPQTAPQTPTCAVPRLDETRQVMQPSPAQVDWASQMAEQGLLTGSSYTRPANYANMGFAAYAPSSDFPPIALEHPAGDSWNSVPRSVYDAIMAQESNFSQASWHAPEGTAGDPLIADYYGAAGDIVSINYAGADCGYGVGQVTDGMHVGDTMFSARGQAKIAVDYQENIAAGLQILESTWNQLYDAGILANGGDPRYLENWYFAAWAYNSGVQPTGTYNPNGCTPGPSCTGADGTWGMGWANNPANPDYPPSRLPYLQSTYADAAHPSDWPYEERVLGWMASPILRDNGSAYSAPSYQGGNTWLQEPGYTSLCSLAQNDCDPTKNNPNQTDAGHCQLNDYECWWHAPLTWVSNCSTSCATSAYQFSGGTEPVDTNQNPFACNVDRSKVASNAIIVDDQTSPNLNLQGCSGENWTSNGTFAMNYGTNSNGDPIGAIDVHQLGSGLGGRILFSHTEDGSNPNLIDTGTWTPNLPSLQYYKLKIHIPALGAEATDVVYTINPGGGANPWKIRVNQAWNTDTWVTIGTFAMQNGGSVVLTNQSTVVDTTGQDYFNFDVAWDALAFIPMGGTPGTPIGGPPTVQDAPKGSNPAWVQCGCGQRTAGDPVDTSTGYYGDSWTDLSTPGRGRPLTFSRSYSESTADPNGPNKTLAMNGPFGYGWTYSYNLSATTNATTGAVTIKQDDGSQVSFTLSGGVYTATEPRDDATLTKSGTSYTYTVRGRDIDTFDVSTGHLTAEQTLAGGHASTPYKTALAYNASGQLSTITDPGGRVYTLTWTGSHITQLKDSAGRTVSYVYDTSNDLTDVYGVGTSRGTTIGNEDHAVYAYNTTTHLMTSFRTPKNYGGAAGAVTAMTYDSAERVLTQTDPLGRITTFNYGPSSSPSLVAGQTLVTDPSGHKILYTYSGGLLTSETRGYGTTAAATSSYTYDPLSLGVSTKVDPGGNTTTYSYDDHGNLTSQSDALGYTTNYAYDAMGDKIESIDPTGLATVNVYDQAGHIKTSSTTTNDGTVAYGDLTSTTTTQANNVVESTTGNFGPAPTRTTNFYYDDPAHPDDPSRVIDPLNNTVTSTYDSAGDLTSSMDALGRKTLQGWDTSRGLMTSKVSPSGVAAGVLTTCTPPATGCTTMSYDAHGNLLVTTDPLGHTSKSTYDANGETLTSTDGDNNQSSFSYDAADQLTKSTTAAGPYTTKNYNPDGTVNYTLSSAGAKTSYTYDPLGRVLTTTNPDLKVTTTTYNAAGQAATIKDPLGTIATISYDADGRRTGVSYTGTATPPVSGISYDPDGRPVAETDGTGNSVWSYDPFGELTSTTNGAGVTTNYTWNATAHPLTVSYPSGGTVSYGYDAAGQATTVTDLAGQQIVLAYSADSLPSKVTYPNGDAVTTGYNNGLQQNATTLSGTAAGALSYGRDNAGELSSRAPSGSLTGSSQTFSYTANQQLKTSVSGTTTNYSYDAGDNLQVNASTTQFSDPAGELCWSVAGTVASPTCGAIPSSATTYTYDASGNRLKSTPATGTASSYSYNGADQLTSASTPAGSAGFSYQSDGLRASETVAGVTQNFTWGHLASRDVLLSDGSAQYIYGPDGMPLEQVVAGTTSYFVHDSVGSTVALLSSTGAVVGTYSYGNYGQVASHTGTSTPLQFGQGYADPQTGLLYLQHRYYDPTTGAFLTVDPDLAATGHPYSYADDNPGNNTDPTGNYTAGVCGTGAAHVALMFGVNAEGSVCLVRTVDADGTDEIGFTETVGGGGDFGGGYGAGVGVSYQVSNAEHLHELGSWFTQAGVSAEAFGGVSGAGFWGHGDNNRMIFGGQLSFTVGPQVGVEASLSRTYTWVQEIHNPIAKYSLDLIWDGLAMPGGLGTLQGVRDMINAIHGQVCDKI
jgi:RHS repeat-associated protein